MLTNLPGRRFLTCCLIAAVLNAYSMTALASPSAAPFAELSASGVVTLDGAAVISGTTVFPRSKIVTAESSRASITLGGLGRVALAGATSFALDYDAANISGVLEGGGASVVAPKGVAVRVSAGGVAVAAEAAEDASFTVERRGEATTVTAHAGAVLLNEGGRQLRVRAGEHFTSGMAAPAATRQDDDDDDDDDDKKVAFLLLGIGAVVTAIIIVLTREADDDSVIGGDGGGNPSPLG